MACSKYKIWSAERQVQGAERKIVEGGAYSVKRRAHCVWSVKCRLGGVKCKMSSGECQA